MDVPQAGLRQSQVILEDESALCPSDGTEVFDAPNIAAQQAIQTESCSVEPEAEARGQKEANDGSLLGNQSQAQSSDKDQHPGNDVEAHEPALKSPNIDDALPAEQSDPDAGSSNDIFGPLICRNDAECEQQGLGVATGTGFFISTDGYLLTNEHVITDSRELHVIFDEEPILATEVYRDSELDIALLKVEATTPSLPIDLTIPRKGEEVAVIGYPSVHLLGNEVKATFGHINSLSGPQNTPIFLQFSAATQPGNSGSPLINSKGSVVGLVTASLNQVSALEQTGSLAQNVNFALKTEFFSSPKSYLGLAVARSIQGSHGADRFS